jgi:hypothetical protein
MFLKSLEELLVIVVSRLMLQQEVADDSVWCIGSSDPASTFQPVIIASSEHVEIVVGATKGNPPRNSE